MPEDGKKKEFSAENEEKSVKSTAATEKEPTTIEILENIDIEALRQRLILAAEEKEAAKLFLLH